MPKHAKIMDGQDIFYSKLAIYLHIYKHRSQENLSSIFGVSSSTMRGWVKEFNRSRLESILKNFKLEAVPEAEGLQAEECDLQEIQRLLVRQAERGSTAATKLLLELKRDEREINEEELTVEDAVNLLRQWCGPRRCSQCGHEDVFKYEPGLYPVNACCGVQTAQ